MKIKIGRKVRDDDMFKEIEIYENKTTTQNRNYFCIATQSSGKTNLLMLLLTMLYNLFVNSSFKFGALPIVFAPSFEFMQIESPSKSKNMPPNIEPEGINCSHITFPICEPIRNPKLNVYSFDFSSFDERMILGFTDLRDEDKYFGAIKKLIGRIKNGYTKGKWKNKIVMPPREFNLKNFIDEVREDSQLKDTLFHVFTDLRDKGMFDTKKYPALDLKKIVVNCKPIIFHFGDLDERQRISGIAGIILKQLWDISTIYYNAHLKKQDNQKLDEFEEFLLVHWTVALLMDEAHQILYATKSGGMALESKHPSHYWFKKITALMGRKRGYKYSFIVTQKFMEIFYGIRTTFDELIIGQTVYPDDKVFLEQDLKIRPNHITKMTRLPRFCWTFLNIDRYQKRRKKCASKVRVFLSPAGQPE